MNCSDLKTQVGQYFADNLVSKVIDTDCILLTPILNADMAPVEIWIYAGSEKVAVTDEGEAINQLFSSGVDVFSSKPLLALARRIASQFGVQFDNGAYTVESGQERLGDAVNRVAQASQAASYLVYKRTGRTRSRFEDTIEKALIDHSINYTAKYRLRGQASTQIVPFYINSDKNVLLQPLSAVSVESARDKAQRVGYKWLDLRQRYSAQYRYTVLIDDSTPQKQEIWEDGEAIAPLREYSSRVFTYTTELPLLIESLH